MSTPPSPRFTFVSSFSLFVPQCPSRFPKNPHFFPRPLRFVRFLLVVPLSLPYIPSSPTSTRELVGQPDNISNISSYLSPTSPAVCPTSPSPSCWDDEPESSVGRAIYYDGRPLNDEYTYVI
ncbi:hypothetical protein ACHWQZ_G016115 [Mnemiopsis leidyi]